MAITKAQKKEILSDFETVLKDSSSVVFVHFKGLKVSQTTSLRKSLKTAGVGYVVAKKTLAKKALTGTKTTGELPELAGEIAFAYGKDLIAPAREIYEFQKKNKENISIVGGIFDGKYMSKEEMVSIASIPSQKTLYAQFVNIINSPIQGFVMVLDGIAKSKGEGAQTPAPAPVQA